MNYLCMKKGIKISMDILEENFKLHYRPLCMYATSMLGTTDNVEDIVLDCFVKLWDVLKVKHIDNIKNYLYKSVRNACYDARSHSSISELDIDSAENITQTEVEDNSELAARLWTAIDSLPERCKKIFLMSKLEDKSYSEIAEELGVSVKTVEAQVTKAYKRLRTKAKDIYYFVLSFFS